MMQLQMFSSTGRSLHRVERLCRDLSSLTCSSQAGLSGAQRKEGEEVDSQRFSLKRLRRSASNSGFRTIGSGSGQKRRKYSTLTAQTAGGALEFETSTEDLKAQLLDSLFGIERGLTASSEIRAELSELVTQLEARNPTPSPNELAHLVQELTLLDGTWKLVYTASSELLPLLALGQLPFVTVGDVTQRINSLTLTVENKVYLEGPFSKTAFSATAALEVTSPKRLQVTFQQGRLATPQLLENLDFPSTVNVLGQFVDLSRLKSALQPVNGAVREAALQLSDAARQIPDLQFPIPGRKAQSWLLNTYLDSDLRISRGDGGSIFVMVRGYDGL